MGAGFLSAIIGIPSYGPTQHHFNHVDSWVEVMRQDHRTIFRIASAACAAASFILSFSRAEAVPA
jgi:antirestriction protein ArdC